ncbi:MAG TPA: hypothetical protein DCO75_00615 [Fibrobacteres bacterium]|jgi:hypothetical protein|nr:hypothetical protein [Fibrobacterota bacterium]
MKLARLMVIALAATSFLFAQEAATTTTTAAPKAEKTAKKEAVKTIAGKVVSVDAVANTIIVKVKKAEDTLSVEAGAKIVSGKKEITLGDITADASVTITFKVVDGKKVATKISEKVAAAKTSKKEKVEAAPATEPAAAPAAAPAAEPAAK